MKILIIDFVNYTDYPTGGIMAFYRNLLSSYGNELLLAGYSMKDEDIIGGKWIQKTLFDKTYNYYSIAQIKRNPARPFIPDRIKNCYRIWKHIRKILEYNDYGIIFTQSPEVLCFLPKDKLSITCFLSPGLSNPLSISRYKWARKLGFLYDKFVLMPKASKVKWFLAAGDKNARECFAKRSCGKIKTDKIIEFPTRYDDKYYYIIDRDEARRKLKIDHESLIYTTVGRLNWFKGWKFMIDAFEKVHSFNSDSYLYFIGDGEDEDLILRYITTRKLNNNIFLLGKLNQKDIAMHLNASDAFIMGSYKEGWSTTLVEACACSVPCVITNFSSAKEMVTDGKNGYVIQNRDEQVFADRMIDVLALSRDDVIMHNKCFVKLAISNLKVSLNTILYDDKG